MIKHYIRNCDRSCVRSPNNGIRGFDRIEITQSLLISLDHDMKVDGDLTKWQSFEGADTGGRVMLYNRVLKDSATALWA